MKFDQKIENYINLILKVGINIQKNDKISLSISTKLDWFAQRLVQTAYELGAFEVIVNFTNDELSSIRYKYASDESLKTVYEFQKNKDSLLAEDNYKIISVSSPNPNAMKGVDSKRVQLASSSYLEVCNKLKKNTASNLNTWCVIACANQEWADFATDGDIDKLWDMIFKATRSDQENCLELWEKHIEKLSKIALNLNEKQYEYLVFKNDVGTNLKVNLVNNHIWSAADDKNGRTDQTFIANIPTEEIFTMPDKYGVNGKVVATKPLNNNGQIIEDFWLEFKDGKVINFDAKKGYSALETIIKSDDGSSYLGEVALVSKFSPINQMNQLFYNTLFDENSSCHLALGNAYPTNIENGVLMDKDEKERNHVNSSKEHVDFMFGSDDMCISAFKEGKERIIFEDGDFKS